MNITHVNPSDIQLVIVTHTNPVNMTYYGHLQNKTHGQPVIMTHGHPVNIKHCYSVNMIQVLVNITHMNPVDMTHNL